MDFSCYLTSIVHDGGRKYAGKKRKSGKGPILDRFRAAQGEGQPYLQDKDFLFMAYFYKFLQPTEMAIIYYLYQLLINFGGGGRSSLRLHPSLVDAF